MATEKASNNDQTIYHDTTTAQKWPINTKRNQGSCEK